MNIHSFIHSFESIENLSMYLFQCYKFFEKFHQSSNCYNNANLVVLNFEPVTLIRQYSHILEKLSTFISIRYEKQRLSSLQRYELEKYCRTSVRWKLQKKQMENQYISIRITAESLSVDQIKLVQLLWDTYLICTFPLARL